MLDDLRIIPGAPFSMLSDSAKVTILPPAGKYTRIGDAGTTSHTFNANDDLMVTGRLEVDGYAYFDSNSLFYGETTFSQNVKIATAQPIDAGNADGNYYMLRARDSTVGQVEIARVAGAADPFFHLGLGSGTTLYGVGIRTVAVTMDHATHGALNAADVTDNAVCWQQPAGSTLLGVRVALTEQFVAPSLTDLDFTLGESGGDEDGLLVQTMNCVSDAVATQYKTRGALWSAVDMGDYYTQAAKDWYIFVTATGANLNTLTAGTLTAYFTYLDLP